MMLNSQLCSNRFIVQFSVMQVETYYNSALYVSDTPATHLSSAVDHIDHPPPSPTSTDGWGEINENGVQEEESDKDGGMI